MNGETEMSAVVMTGEVDGSVKMTTGATAQPTPPKPAGPELSQGAVLILKIVAGMDVRRQERAHLVAETLSRGVAIEAEMRQALKDRDAGLKAAQEAYEAEILEAKNLRDARCDVIDGAFRDLMAERNREADARLIAVQKIDYTLTQQRKQLDAELAKLDPQRPAKS